MNRKRPYISSSRSTPFIAACTARWEKPRSIKNRICLLRSFGSVATTPNLRSHTSQARAVSLSASPAQAQNEGLVWTGGVGLEERDAAPDQIRAAYRRLVLKYHPHLLPSSQ